MKLRFVSAFLSFVMVLVASSANADLITDWNYIALDAIRVDFMTPPEAARALAILGVAVYDSVNAIERTHTVYKVSIPPFFNNASEEAAAVSAAYFVLQNLFPTQSFRSQYKTGLSTIPRGLEKFKGIFLGYMVAHRILFWRWFDGFNAYDPYRPTDPPIPGRWQPTPPNYDPFLLPQWGNVKPFAMTTNSQFRQPPPPALTSPEYTNSFNEVKNLGSIDSATRTADQTEIALFWEDGAGTVTPPGHFFEIALNVAASQGNTLSENARLFALLGIAMADAAICAWDMKKFYDFWRPSTAIQKADTDGNPYTVPDPNWLPLLYDPNFPAYVSGHSTFGGAAAAILADFFGTDDISFTSTSDGLPGVMRSFNSFSEAAAENGRSRIYGGVHYDFDDFDGLTAGEELGHYVYANYLMDLPPFLDHFE